MPPKVAWNRKDAVRLMNLYCLYDHLPPRHVPDGIPKTIEQLGDELTKLYGVQIDRRSLQYQLPLRRYQLWKQFDPETCPPPDTKLKRGMLHTSPFFRNPNAVRIIMESDIENKAQCSTNSELTDPPPSEPSTLSSPVPIEAHVNLSFNDGRREGTFEDKFTDNDAPESINSFSFDKKEPGATQKKEESCEKSKKKQTSEKPFTWVLNSRCSLSWIAVHSGPSVKLFKPNKSVGNRKYFVCVGCRSTAYFDNDSDHVIESQHYGTCEVINTVDFDEEQTKRRLKLKRPQKDPKSSPNDDESQKSPAIDSSVQMEEQEVPKLDFSLNDCQFNEPILPEKEISTGRVQFTRALNSRLQPNLIATSHNDGIKLFTINKHKDGKAYVKCTGCGTSGSFFIDEDYLQFKSHGAKCTTITREDYIDEQAHRNSRLLALKGEQPQKAYRRGLFISLHKSNHLERFLAFTAARKVGFGNTLRPYCFSKSQIARWAKKGASEYPDKLLNGERWLLGKTDSTEVYCTDNAIRELANCRILVVDGTFETAPKGFFQVLTFHGLSQNVEGQEEFNPLCFALMRDKKESSYTEVVKMIMARMESLKVECKVERIHADYEQGLRNALKPMVPENGVRGCLFHFSQAVLKRVGKGLYKFYNMQFGKKYRPEFMRIRVWIRTLLALPCLPQKDMQWLWETLRQPPKPPHFVPDWPYDLLSCTFFGLGRVRNTNVAEGYHSAQKHIYSRKPRVATFLQQRCVDAEMAEVRFRQLKIPGTAVKPCDKLYVTLREKVKRLEEDYLAGLKFCVSDITRQLYMIRFARRSSFLLHDTVNKSGTTRKNAKRKALLDVHNDSLQWRQCLGVDEDLYSSIVSQEKEMEEDGYVSNGEIDSSVASFAVKDASDVDKPRDKYSDIGTSVADDASLYDECASSLSDSDECASNLSDSDECASSLSDSDECVSSLSDSDECVSSLSDSNECAPSQSVADENAPSQSVADGACLVDVDADSASLIDKSRKVLKPVNMNKNKNKRVNSDLPPTRDTDDINENEVLCIDQPKRVQECRLPSAGDMKEKALKAGLKFVKSVYSKQTLEIHGKAPKILHNVFADGNCGYRALSYAITGTEANHVKIRADISAKLIDSVFVDRFRSAFDDDIEEYAEQHRMPATVAWDQSKWMTSRDMFAACLLYNIDIFVYNQQRQWSLYTANFMRREDKLEPKNPAILLYNPSNVHYQVVIAVDL